MSIWFFVSRETLAFNVLAVTDVFLFARNCGRSDHPKRCKSDWCFSEPKPPLYRENLRIHFF